MANDIIDIVVTDNSDNVQINATPNLITINVTNTSGNIIGSNYYLANTFSALPAIGETTILYVVSATSLIYRWNGTNYVQINSIGTINWGSILGTLSSQTDLQNALNLKAPLASPTFTGTVSGVTKSMVGLGNVDNTTDLLKPISTATQTALNLKYDASNPSSYITLPSLSFVAGSGAYNNTTGVITIPTNNNQLTNGAGYLTSSSAITTYVPYTGASGNVNLGTNNISANNFLNAFSNITASGTQVVLTVASAPEIVVNGSGGQTIKLPDATTLSNGASFLFNNNQSSGAILVNNNSNTLVVSVPSGGYAEVILIDNTTAAGSYDRHFHAPANVSWSTNTFDYAGSITSATWNGNAIAINRGGTGATSASAALSNLGGIGLTSISATSPIVYTNTTGVISIPVATTSINGYLSSTDWTTFNNKANALSGTTNTLAKFTSASAIGNSNITDTGSMVTIASSLTLSGSVTGVGNSSNYSVTASSGTAKSKSITSTLIAAANSNILIGLDIAPTFTNGAFTGVLNYALRVQGKQLITFSDSNYLAGLIINNTSTSTASSSSVSLIVNGVTGGSIGYLPSNWSTVVQRSTLLTATNGTNKIGFSANIDAVGAQAQDIWFSTLGSNTTYQMQIKGNGNVQINTNTDSGYRFDVAGTTRFQGTTASDTAQLGSELAAVTGTGTNWTLAGTNLNVGGYTHTAGSTTALTTSLAAVSGTYYQVTITVTTRTAGSVTFDYGGISLSSITSTLTFGPLASSTAVLTITPTTDFDGTIVVSIKSIGTSVASTTFATSGGTTSIEFRANTAGSNTFIGQSAGNRNTTGTFNVTLGVEALQNNTTGGFNVAIGRIALQNNTYGAQNTAIGHNTLNLNTIGSSNIGLGNGALASNTTGSNNTALGGAAGRYIANGSTANAITDNSIFIGQNTKALANNQTNQIVIGYNSTGLGSNTTVLCNSSTTTTARYGKLLLGSTTDAGYKLDVTGTARVSASAYLATASGSVGIGTTSPSAKLDVNGSIKFTSIATTDYTISFTGITAGAWFNIPEVNFDGFMGLVSIFINNSNVGYGYYTRSTAWVFQEYINGTPVFDGLRSVTITPSGVSTEGVNVVESYQVYPSLGRYNMRMRFLPRNAGLGGSNPLNLQIWVDHINGLGSGSTGTLSLRRI